MLLGLTAPASATPLEDKRAEAVRIKAQVEELDEKLEIAAEEYNEAREQYEAVTADVQSNEALAAELEARQVTLETHLSTRVVSMYRQGPLGALEVLLGATSFEEFATMWDVLQTLNGRDAAQVAELRETRTELERVHVELAAQQVEAKAHAEVMERQRVEIEEQLQERERLLAGVEEEIAELVREAEEAARRRAAAAAAAARPATDYGNPTNASLVGRGCRDVEARGSLQVGGCGPGRVRLQRVHDVVLRADRRESASQFTCADQRGSARLEGRSQAGRPGVLRPRHHPSCRHLRR